MNARKHADVGSEKRGEGGAGPQPTRPGMRSILPLDQIKDPHGGPIAGKGSLAFLSPEHERVDCAVVFVHGFHGSPVGTWEAFAECIAADPDFVTVDAFFYGYRSVSSQVGIEANLLDYFLGRVVEKTLSVNAPATPGSDSSGYKHVIIVAHSLGAVIARQAALNAHHAQLPWVKRANLVLFAPAHAGSRLGAAAVRLIEALPVLGMFARAIAIRCPPTEDLDPHRSPYLRGLRMATEAAAAAAAPEQRTPFRAQCAFGQNERIVIVDHFKCDDRQRPDLFDYDHFAICKPKSSTEWPVTYLKMAIERVRNASGVAQP